MAEAGESFIYLYLGVVGANKNCVGSMRPDLSDWTSKDFDLHGYARYIKEAENVIRIQKRTRSFLINRMTGAEEESNGHSGEYIDFSPSGPEDPDSMASLDNIPSEAITNSTQRMEKEWKEKFKGIWERKSDSPPTFKEFVEQEGNRLIKWNTMMRVVEELIKDLERVLVKNMPSSKHYEANTSNLRYFDNGKDDARGHHILLVRESVKGLFVQVTVLAYQLLKKWEKIRLLLKEKLPEEYERLEAKIKRWSDSIVLRDDPGYGARLAPQDSDDTSYGIEELPDDKST